MVSPIAGMHGVDDFVANVHPESWRSGLLRQEPNGQAPLFALTSLMGSRKVDSDTYHWFTKSLPESNFSVTDVYTDGGLTAAYNGAGASGAKLYLKCAEEDADRVVPGITLFLRRTDDASATVMSKVIGESDKNGSNSSIPVRLLEADDNSVTAPKKYMTENVDALIGASIHPDGGLRPSAVAYQETEFSSYTQIHRTALDLTRRKIQSSSRTVNAYKETKRDTMIDHSKQWEWSLLFGEKTLNTNSTNGKRETTTRGVVPWIKASASDNYRFFHLETGANYAGKTWAEAGWRWLQEMMRLSFLYTGGGDEKLVLCGSTALMYIQWLVENVSSGYFIKPGQLEFGIHVTQLISPVGGMWNLKTHPMMSIDPVETTAFVVLEPRNLEYVYMLDTTFVEQKDKTNFNGEGGFDGINEEFKTDAGIELHYPNTFMYLNGIGTDNVMI